MTGARGKSHNGPSSMVNEEKQRIVFQMRAAVTQEMRRVHDERGGVREYCSRLLHLLIGQCSQCLGHDLWDEAGRIRRKKRPSLVAGLQQTQGSKFDSAP